MIAEHDRLRILALATGAFALLALGVGQAAGVPGTLGVAATGLVLAGAMWQARTISTFLRVFLTVFALEYVGFGLTLLLSGVG